MLGLLYIVPAFFSVVQISATRQAVYVGHEVVGRLSEIELGRAVLVFHDLQLRDGRVTAFHVFSTRKAQAVFQIWRPNTTNAERLTLIGEKNVTKMFLGEQTIPLSRVEEIEVENGDMVGFMHTEEAYFPISASFTPRKPSPLQMISLPEDNYPVIGDTLDSTFITYPYVFSMAVSYVPNEHVREPGGPPGATGATGRRGPRGDPGRDGPPGSRGPPGNPGTRGHPGSPGPPGPAGSPGADGPPGETGHTGATGPAGPPGDKGDTGLPGQRGPDGRAGATGATGIQGPPGETGVTGAVGATGPVGSSGQPGEKGDIGATGADGPKGDKGDKGDPGSIGATGPPGPRGPIYEDADECALGAADCQHLCINDIGSYHCACVPGYLLATDKHTCTDIDECEKDNGGCQGLCINLEGSYKCTCPAGLHLSINNHDCLDDAECETRERCGHDEVCVETYGSYYCITRSNQLPNDYSIPAKQNVMITEDELVNRQVVIGLMVWLSVLSAILIVVLFLACLKKLKTLRERKLYLDYKLSSPLSSNPDDRRPYPRSREETPEKYFHY